MQARAVGQKAAAHLERRSAVAEVRQRCLEATRELTRRHQPLATLGETAREASGARPGSGREISSERTGLVHPLDPHICLHEVRRERHPQGILQA